MVEVKKSELREMYEDKSKTVEDIAKHYGVTKVTIYDWLKQFDIPITRGTKAARLVDDESGGAA